MYQTDYEIIVQTRSNSISLESLSARFVEKLREKYITCTSKGQHEGSDQADENNVDFVQRCVL